MAINTTHAQREGGGKAEGGRPAHSKHNAQRRSSASEDALRRQEEEHELAHKASSHNTPFPTSLSL
eukprot:12929799-Prorocentrum_lima.AAC.1